MKAFVCVVGLLCLLPSMAMKGTRPPKVQVYSRLPGNLGKANTLICHTSDFFPPEITVKVLKNGVEMDGATQTDLAFEGDWYYHLTKSVAFTPNKEDQYACNVTHMGNLRTFHWEADE